MTRILLVVVQDKSANLKARRTDLSPTLSLYKQFGSSPGADTCSFPSTPPSLPPPIWHVSPRVSALRGSGHHRPSKNALELETHANSKLSFAWLSEQKHLQGSVWTSNLGFSKAHTWAPLSRWVSSEHPALHPTWAPHLPDSGLNFLPLASTERGAHKGSSCQLGPTARKELCLQIWPFV